MLHKRNLLLPNTIDFFFSFLGFLFVFEALIKARCGLNLILLDKSDSDYVRMYLEHNDKYVFECLF